MAIMSLHAVFLATFSSITSAILAFRLCCSKTHVISKAFRTQTRLKAASSMSVFVCLENRFNVCNKHTVGNK